MKIRSVGFGLSRYVGRNIVEFDATFCEIPMKMVTAREANQSFSRLLGEAEGGLAVICEILVQTLLRQGGETCASFSSS